MNLKKINTINIFGTTYSIIFKDKVIDPNSNEKIFLFGLTNFTNHTIEISTKTPDNIKIHQSEIEITILHEIIHAIINTGQYHTYNDDEPFVEYLARAIHQLNIEHKDLF